jgi:hypothetical protein
MSKNTSPISETEEYQRGWDMAENGHTRPDWSNSKCHTFTRLIAEKAGYDDYFTVKYCDVGCLIDSQGMAGKLKTAISLIQEAKGFEGVSGGAITDHLDAAENWINDVILTLESKS